MVRALLVRGMLAGLSAGMLAFAFAWVFGEPQVDLAIGFETHVHHMAGEAPEPELVSRAVQSTAGLATGVVVYAGSLGGIFALAFACAYGRLGASGARGTAALLAAAGFTVLVLVPQIKYPANPPSIGEPETIGLRTALYFTMIALSVFAAIAATSTGRLLARRVGAWYAAILGGAAYLAVVVAVMLLLPPVDEVPTGFAAATLWRFRLASLGIELVLWTALGLVFGALAERVLGAAVRSRSPLGRRSRA